MRNSSRVIGVAVLAALAAMFSGCSGDDAEPASPPERRLTDIDLASSLRRFDSCDAVRAWARDELAPRVGAYGFPGGWGGRMGAVTEDLAMAGADDGRAAAREVAPPSPAAQSVPDAPSFSGTNVQVEGVDEPDVVKTDGTRIVSISNGRLHLTSAADARTSSSLTLPEGMFDGEILLSGDRVLVFGTASSFAPALDVVDRSFVAPELAGTRVLQVDIQNDTLVLVDTVVLDGVYISARMVDDVARLVVHADQQQRLPFVTPAGPSPEAEARAKQMNREIVEQAAAEDLLPHWRRLGADGSVAEEGTLVGCEDAHAPNTFAGFGMVTVVSVDLSDGLRAGMASSGASGVMAGGQIVYSSPDHLYVAAPEWVDWSTLSSADALVVSEATGTDIHRFDIRDPREARYEMSGHVDGVLVDQFAMDEFDGALRVATTTGSAWVTGEGESESHVVVLRPQGDVLGVAGQVGGLGRGEMIQSVRFLGPVGYVVTFEQTDPLYTIDLADAANPRVAGELKILGFSAYLHPVADGMLLGVGQDATEEGRQLGTQVALFDVRDPARPTRVAQATLPNASSGAEWDHRAFLWWPASKLAAIPVSAYDPNPFEGLVGFTVDAAGGTITERGRVVHPPVQPEQTDGGGGIDGTTGGSAGGDDIAVSPGFSFPTPIMRSFVIGDRLWTLSTAGLAASDLATLGQTSFVAF
jgi:hypothetical protein